MEVQYYAAAAAEEAYEAPHDRGDGTSTSVDLAELSRRQAEWLKAQHEEFPPVRVKSPQDDDPDFIGVWFGGMFNIPEHMRYVAPVKRPRGRPRKDGKPAGSVSK